MNAFRLVAFAGFDACGNEEWETEDFPTMGQAVRALAEWSRVTSEAVIRRMSADKSTGRCVAELEVASDFSHEPLIAFRFAPQRRARWSALPVYCKVSWILNRAKLTE